MDFGNVLSNIRFMQFEWYTFEHYVLNTYVVGSLEHALVNSTMQKAYFLYGKCVVRTYELSSKNTKKIWRYKSMYWEIP